jgi:hypothetical protein
MRNKENKTEWIDSYLDAELEGTDLEEFEHLLKSDKYFRLEVEAQKAVRGSLQQWGDKELKNKFQQFHAQFSAEKNKIDPNKGMGNSDEKKSRKKSRWISLKDFLKIAASLSILLVAAIFLINRNQSSPQESEVFTAYHTFKTAVETSQTESMGYAGEKYLTDLVTVQLIQDDRYPFHYRFRDTLQIFSTTPIREGEFRVEYNGQEASYFLHISGKRYEAVRGFNRIIELDPLD